MRRFVEAIDLHISALLILLVLATPCLGWRFPWLGWYLLGATVILPQGRIITRVSVDHPRFKSPKAFYLLANELQVILFTGVSTGLWFLLDWLVPTGR